MLSLHEVSVPLGASQPLTGPSWEVDSVSTTLHFAMMFSIVSNSAVFEGGREKDLWGPRDALSMLRIKARSVGWHFALQNANFLSF